MEATKPKLRILIVSADKYPPFRLDVKVLFGKELMARGHTIDWVLQSEKPRNKPYWTKWNNGRVWVGKTDNGQARISRMRKHVFGILHSFSVFKILNSDKYEIIQVKDKAIAALVAIVASKLYKKKFVYWLSFPFPERSLVDLREGKSRYPIYYKLRGHVLAFLLYKVILPSADHIFVQSEQMKRDITEKNINPDKMTPVPMGVSLGDYSGYRYKNNIDMSKNDKNIIYIGTISKIRKIDFLVRVLDIVLNSIGNTKLILVGDGDDDSDRELIYSEAERLGIRNSVVITGYLSRNEMLKYVSESDVCVSPFYPTPILNSTSPTKLVEYMAMSKPVVANDHPEQKMVLEASKGGLCTPFEEIAFANAIINIVQNPTMAKEMGENGRKYVENYRDYKIIADFVEDTYYEKILLIKNYA